MRFSINEFQKWLLLFMSLMWEEIPATGPDSWVWFPLGMRPHISLLKFSVLSPAYSFIVIILMTSSPPADQQSISKSEKLSVNNTSLQPCWWLCEVLWARWQCLNANVQQVWCLACSPSYISPSACTHLQIRTKRKSAAEADEWLKRQEALQMLHRAGNNVVKTLILPNQLSKTPKIHFTVIWNREKQGNVLHFGGWNKTICRFSLLLMMV